MRLRTIRRPAPTGLTVAVVVTLTLAVANYASGVYGGAIVAGVGAVVTVLLWLYS